MSSIWNQKNYLESIPEWEKLAEIRENQDKFESEYKQKLLKIFPEDLVWKISGAFENSWDIEKSLENILDEKWFSEENLSKVKDFLINNLEISEENLKEIQEELEKTEKLKDLDIKLWELISKVSKISEKTENDELFEKTKEAKKIQENWTIEEKEQFILDLENILSQNWEKWEDFWKQEKIISQKSQIWIPDENWEISVESADSWNDKWYMEETILTWDLFSKDKNGESNDYWNSLEVQENKESILKKWINIIKWEENKESKNQKNYSEINWEYFSVLENLFNSNEISEEKFNSINEDLSWKTNQEKVNVFKKFVENLPNSDNKTNILKNFDEKKEKVTEENFEKSDFFVDSKSIIDFDKSVWGLEIMLAENYIYIWDKEKSQDKNKEQSLQSSLEITKNKIIKNHSPDFRKNNAELIWEISSEKNLDKKYKKLKELYKESLKEDAKKWWKKWKEEMERKKENLIWEYKENLEKIKEAEKKWEIEELEKLNKQKLEIEKQAKEIQNLIEELEKIAKEVDLDIWKNDENWVNKKE